MTRPRLVALLSIIALFATSAAIAGEKGLVSNSGGTLKAEPKPKGKKVDKLKQGIMVDVVDHSADGLWVKVVASGPDGNQEGWVEKSYVRSLSRYGFSWERKNAAGGNQTVGKTTPLADKPADPPPADKPADPVPPPDDGGWGKETPIEDTSDSEWDKTTTEPVADPTATPAAAPEATPTPAEDEGWGTETDLTK